MLIGDLLGAVDGIQLGANEWTELGFWYRRMFGTTFGAMEGILLGKSDRIEIGFSGYWATRLIAKSILE